MPGYMHPTRDIEIRLTYVQGAELEACELHPQRRPDKPSWTWLVLLRNGFVTSAPRYSERLKRHTRDVIYTITDEGRRYLQMGRNR